MKTFFTLIIMVMIGFLATLSYDPVNPMPTVYSEPSVTTGGNVVSFGFVEPVEEPTELIFSEKEIVCLQKNIFFEAATEPIDGRIAVASVTMNRVKSPDFPSTICGVVEQAKLNSNGVPRRHKCQFSWWCNGRSDVPDLSNDYVLKVWYEIGALAVQAANGDIADSVDGAVFYHATHVTPDWNFKLLAIHSTIGDHIFYTQLQ